MSKNLPRLLWTTAILLSWSYLAKAQGTSQSSLTNQAGAEFQKIIGDIKAANSNPNRAEAEQEIRDAFSPNTHASLFALTMGGKAEEEFIKTLEDVRTDKQVGGSAANAGSTSLVSKGSVPSILGFGVENGALVKSTSGTTVTFRGDPVGIIKALGNEGFISSYNDDDPATRHLRDLSFALSFDTSRGRQAGTLIGDQQQLSSYSFRYDIVNRRDPRHSDYRRKWSDLISTKGNAIAVDAGAFEKYFDESFRAEADPTLVAWLKTAQKALLDAKPEEVEKTVRDELGKLRSIHLPQRIARAVNAYKGDVDAFLLTRDDILKAAANGAIVTFEYTNNRQISAPNQSNFNLIAEDSFFAGKGDLTANASLTILDKIPSGMNLKRVRDFKLSSQLDIPLGEVQKIGSIVFTMSGLYQRMLDNAVMPGGMMTAQGGNAMPGMVVPNTKGDIGVGQLKLTIPVKGSGVKIPLSLTFANRTELIKESEVRGNVGVTFDLDSIFASLKP